MQSRSRNETTGPAADGQGEVIAFLSRPDAHGGKPVERVDTHISVVFLVGDRAFKLKRAMKTDFLDYSTLEDRRRLCAAEVEINSRSAPDLYLGAVPVTRDAAGALAIDGDGKPVEWLVAMRRFEKGALFDDLARGGGLTSALMLRTADTVADMHEAAPVAHRLTGVDAIRDVVKSNEMALFARAPRRFRPAEVAEWSKAAEQALDSVGSLLNLRAQQGKIRRCHGDLHLRNIYLDGGTPRLFDAIEFSEAINTIDALYDLSFLLMDLDHRGEHALANLVLNRYLGITGDFAGVPAMPLFLSTRAALRAHISDAVEAAETTSQERKSDEPERYLALARRYLSQSKPALIAIGGHSGSGKSSIARAIAPHIGQLPGAIHLQSDITRKRLFQVRPEVRLGSHAYSEATSAKVYALLREYASHALKAGFSVVVDATFLAAGERQAIEAVALETDTPFIGLWLDAPRAILEERIRRRVADPSDADVEVLASQLGAELPKDGWFAIYAGDSADATAARALGHLSREGVSGLRVSHGMHADPDI